jgi:hypothetical protein
MGRMPESHPASAPKPGDGEGLTDRRHLTQRMLLPKEVSLSEHEEDTEGVNRDASPKAQLADAATAEKKMADGIEEAIGTAASIEEEQMLEAAELLEVELTED